MTVSLLDQLAEAASAASDRLIFRLFNSEVLSQGRISEIVTNDICVSPLSLLDWLSWNSFIKPHAFFCPRDCGGVTVAYLGEVTRVHSLLEAESILFDDASLIGAGLFHGVNGKGLWILPIVELEISAKSLTLNVNLTHSLRATAEFLARITWKFLPQETGKFCFLNETFIPTKERYLSMVENVLQMQGMDKIVFAVKRDLEICSDRDIVAAELFATVIRELNKSGKSDRFLFLFDEGIESFFSQSPELLVRVGEGGLLESEALAGSYRADCYPSDIEMDKLLREHKSVVDFLDERLSKFGKVDWGELKRLGFGNIVHFLKQAKALIPDSENSANVIPLLLSGIEALHPTPAVCGFPVELARKTIIKQEGWDRGYFAGPCGRVSLKAAELCVGIRSASLKVGTSGASGVLSVYAGAGIIAGSDALKEWDEIILKMKGTSNIIKPIGKETNDILSRLPNWSLAASFLFFVELARWGISRVVVCPGSRSTPLVLGAQFAGLAQEIFHDERTAGFFVLGCAKNGEIVPVIVTSGTAVANLVPAAAEAASAGIGFLVLSGDRCWFEQGVGERQVIQGQGRIFTSLGGCWSREVGVVRGGVEIGVLLQDLDWLIGQLWGAGSGGQSCRSRLITGGAAHFNFQFPLEHLESIPLSPYDGSAIDVCSFPASVSMWLIGDSVFTQHMSFIDLDSFIDGCWCKGGAVLVVAGELSEGEGEEVFSWAENRSLPIVADVLSGLPTGGIDRILASELFRGIVGDRVELVIWFGGGIIGKRLENWIKDIGGRSRAFVRVSGSGQNHRLDPLGIVTHYIRGSVGTVLQNQSSACTAELSKWQGFVNWAFSKAFSVTEEISMSQINDDDILTEPLVARIVAATRHGNTFFLSAGMPVRDMDSFGAVRGLGGGLVAMNRGANGIDGVLATCLGLVPEGCESGVTLVYGDVACLHDLSSLVPLFKRKPGNFKVVCVNNDGGGIFSFLPIRAQLSQSCFSPAFDSPHGLNLSVICSSIADDDGKVLLAQTAGELRAALGKDNDAIFVECRVPTDHSVNVELHRRLASETAAKVDDSLKAGKFKLGMNWLRRGKDRRVPMMIFLHGWLGSVDDWTQVVDKMPWTGAMVALTLPGHEMATNKSESYSNLVELSPTPFCIALKGWLDVYSPEVQVILIGYSLGGRLCMHFASLYPQRVAKIFLISSAPLPVGQFRVDRNKKIEERVAQWGGCCAKSQQNMSWFGSEHFVKQLSNDPDDRLFDENNMSTTSSCSNDDFVHFWYGLDVFSDLSSRRPVIVADRALSVSKMNASLLAKVFETMKFTRSFSERMILNKIKGAVIGGLDSKYLKMTGKALNTEVIENAGHALLLENPSEVGTRLFKLLGSDGAGSSPDSLRVSFINWSLEEWKLPLTQGEGSPGLVRMAGGEPAKIIYRQGFYFRMTLLVKTGDQSKLLSGIAEMVEPIRLPRSGSELWNWNIMKANLKEMAQQLILKSWTGNVGNEPELVNDIIQWVVSVKSVCRPLLFCLEQAFLTAFASGLPNFPLTLLIREYLEICSPYPNRFIKPIPPSIGLNSLEEMRFPMPLKVKIGGNPVLEANRLNSIVKCNPLLTLRLDANQSWSADEAIKFSRNLTAPCKAAIEYIEEPLKTARKRRLDILSVGMGIRIGLDEYLFDSMSREDLNQLEFLQSLNRTGKVGSRWDIKAEEPPPFQLVVKPFLLGMSAGLLSNSNVTISCTFESGIGLSFLVCLAAASCGNQGVHGLLPHPAMMRDHQGSGIAQSVTAEFSSLIDSANGSVSVFDCERLLKSRCA